MQLRCNWDAIRTQMRIQLTHNWDAIEMNSSNKTIMYLFINFISVEKCYPLPPYHYSTTKFCYKNLLFWDIIIVGKETHRWPIINGSAMVLIILRDNLCLFVHFIKEVWLVKQEWIYFTWMFWRFSSFTAQFWFEYIFAPLIIFTAKIFYFGLKFYDFMILSFFPI